jgi:hypothetical protein
MGVACGGSRGTEVALDVVVVYSSTSRLNSTVATRGGRLDPLTELLLLLLLLLAPLTAGTRSFHRNQIAEQQIAQKSMRRLQSYSTRPPRSLPAETFAGRAKTASDYIAAVQCMSARTAEHRATVKKVIRRLIAVCRSQSDEAQALIFI